eukprot:Phypoly_transcript_05765.p1 GENE.Phypoly_transcript_05765~~Phypoly_transcript_05765.p1  ORF type:complete len:617 (+),score=123.44 Phypoly_transcript_05765:53-1852(+)
MNPGTQLTPLQKATICVANSDDSNLSGMLVACQLMMGCYSTNHEQSPRLKERLSTKFTPSKQLDVPPPAQKISFGNKKGLDIATLQKLIPNTKTKRVTFNPASYTKPPPKAQTYTTQSNTYNQNTSNYNQSNNQTAPTKSNLGTSGNTNARYNANTAPKPSQQDPPKYDKPSITKRKFEEEEEEEEEKQEAFTTAKEKYITDCATKGVRPKNTKKLGSRPVARKGFKVPLLKKDEKEEEEEPAPPPTKKVSSNAITKPPPSNQPVDETNPNKIESVNGVPLDDERLRNIEPRMLEVIVNEILDRSPKVEWDDIAGLKFAKDVVYEMVVWPMQRSEFFTALRTPPKGLLLFGPPGTGKTLIGKAIASRSGATFFSITASSLTSKWIGEGEKMVRAMFAVARCYQPAVVFIDEIDSLLTQRGDNEHEASRRIKNEFLIQWDGAQTNKEDKLLIVGATNRPQELDEAARRRLVKKVYIPLPEFEARVQLIKNLLGKQENTLTEEDINKVGEQTEGYSGADLHALCSEAALGPLRALRSKDLRDISVDKVRPVSMKDFQKARRQVRASVCDTDLHIFEEFNRNYGSVKKYDEDEDMDDDEEVT